MAAYPFWIKRADGTEELLGGDVRFKAQSLAATPTPPVGDRNVFVNSANGLLSIKKSDASALALERAFATNDFDESGADISSRFIGARAYKAADQTGIVTATETGIILDTEHYDTDAIHDTVTNNTRFTIPIAGYYHIGGCIQWDTNLTGSRWTYIRVNGTTGIARVMGTAAALGGTGGVQHISCDYLLAAGDWVALIVYQDSGTNRIVVRQANWSPEFWIHRIAGA